jgi:hypothetical protein
MMALVGVDNAGDAAESASAVCRGHVLELCCNHLLSLSHDECDNLRNLLFSDLSSFSLPSDDLDEYLTPLLSSLHLLAFLLTLLFTEYLAELLILLIVVLSAAILVEVCLCGPHEYLLLDPLSLASLPFFLAADLLSTRMLCTLPALVAPLLDLFGLKFGRPLVPLSATHSKERHLLLLEECKGAIVDFHENVHCLVDQETVVAETHLPHLEERLVAAHASHFASSLLISLPSLSMLLVVALTNSGGCLLHWLMLMMIIGSIFIILILIRGVHLRRSSAVSGDRGLLIVNLVN